MRVNVSASAHARVRVRCVAESVNAREHLRVLEFLHSLLADLAERQVVKAVECCAIVGIDLADTIGKSLRGNELISNDVHNLGDALDRRPVSGSESAQREASVHAAEER